MHRGDALLQVEYGRVGAEIVEWSHVLCSQLETLLEGGMTREEALHLVFDTNAQWWSLHGDD